MFTYIGTDLDATSVLTLHDSFFVQICCSAASTTFLIYEYLITFDKEVEYFWVKRPNCGSVFFLFTRYVPLVIKAIDMSGYIHMSDKLHQFSPGISAPGTVVLRIMCNLRAWALSGRNRGFTVFIILLCLAPTVTDWVAYHWYHWRRNVMLTAGRGPVILADLLVIALTWYTAYQAGVLRQAPPWLRPSFWWTFTRDGTVHFVAILIMNVLRLCFALRLITPVDVDPACYVILFTDPVTAVLICRFLINVQEVNKQTIRGNDTWLVNASLQLHTEVHLADVHLPRMSTLRSPGPLGHTADMITSPNTYREPPVVHT
ncbi:hypothetical protein OH76DRAFT_1480025 [Lentinus brumalis]|uniref:DUF6533 domain-containing protein n=1 Tax=Lentinus brumalis TaxID=2498619 RepID=A0A371DKB5_9APHY|nr:hypothetical protein OH76DRAFT_1480025 [Polyporus brumalis]